MSISWEQFVSYSNSFISNQSNDSWIWIPELATVRERGGHYLKRKERHVLNVTVSNAEVSPDDPTMISDHSSEKHYYEPQIVYSTTYQVPVLYFTCYTSSGEPLLLEQVWKDLPSSFGAISQKETLITQMEHPVTGYPCFCIHPCNTSKIMCELKTSNNYIAQWYSITAPILGLKISSDVFK